LILIHDPAAAGVVSERLLPLFAGQDAEVRPFSGDAITSERAGTELRQMEERLDELEDQGRFWEIDLYPTPVELVGGAVDGAIVSPGFSVDLIELQALFETIEAVNWNTHGHHGSEPAFISVEGEYQGREVYLRVLSAAPEDEDPGLKVKIAP
jgi:hypothetical protein